MPDWVLLVIGFIIGSIICIISEIISAYHRDRNTWFVPIGIDGKETTYQCRKDTEETTYQCRKCGETFTCAVIERVLYCSACGRKVEK